MKMGNEKSKEQRTEQSENKTSLGNLGEMA